VVALIDSAGAQVEQVRYFAYGIPFGLPAGDVDSDGDVDPADATAFDGLGGYAARADMDLDGDNDSTDRSAIVANDGDALGFAAPSLPGVANRKAYAGYELDDALADVGSIYHVRHRVLHADLGRWLMRDPIGYSDGPSLYAYTQSRPLAVGDPSGLSVSAFAVRTGGAAGTCGSGECYHEVWWANTDDVDYVIVALITKHFDCKECCRECLETDERVVFYERWGDAPSGEAGYTTHLFYGSGYYGISGSGTESRTAAAFAVPAPVPDSHWFPGIEDGVLHTEANVCCKADGIDLRNKWSPNPPPGWNQRIDLGVTLRYENSWYSCCVDRTTSILLCVP
jgi:RHS repeat-associated protein